MPEKSSSKRVMVGFVICLLIGGLAGFLISPSPDISSYENQIEQLETQVTTLQNKVQDLEEEVEDSYSIQEYNELIGQISVLQSQINEYEVDLNEKDNMIEELEETISDLSAQLPSIPQVGGLGTSRSNPQDIGVTMNCLYKDWLDEYYYCDITVLEIKRGNSAWILIEEANMFNDPPEKGYEYILVKIKFYYTQGPTIDTSWDVSEFDFDAISSDGFVYDSPYVVSPSPVFDAELYPGASLTGWASFQVEKTDTKPVLSWGRDYEGHGGIWFKIYG